MIASKAFSTNKKPCADYSVTGLVSLTMACLDYLVMSAYYLEWRTIWPDWLSRRLAEIALLIAGLQHAAILHHDAEPARKMELPQ